MRQGREGRDALAFVSSMRRREGYPERVKPTHLLVGNPTAQSGKNAARIERAQRALALAKIECELMPTLPGGATIQAVRAKLDAGTHRCVVSMGGDGTFREVAAGLLESSRREQVALGMLPTGTANDQGKSFGLDADEDALERNVAVVVGGIETRLDAGRVEALATDGSLLARTVFFDSLGWGISARTLAARNEDRRAVEAAPVLREVYRDHLVYAGALLRTFLASYVVDDAFRARVVADGGSQTIDGLTDLIVKGTRVYGGAWVFDRTSRHDDGLFEVVPFRGKLDWTSKAIVDLDGNPITEEILNTIGVEHSKPFRAARLEITFEHPPGGAPPSAQLDGEEFVASDRVRVEVVPRALRLIVPQSA
jgi:diacylglycerol kinase family enzyme